jgi:hypothetical protein
MPPLGDRSLLCGNLDPRRFHWQTARFSGLTSRSSRARFAASLMRYRVPQRAAATQAGLTPVLGAMKSWRISDDELPTWLHTTLTLLIVSPFALLLIVPGVRAIRDGLLPPMTGPEFGQFFFGNHTLHDHAARLAGWSLVLIGFSFFGVGVGFSRWAKGNSAIRICLATLWVASTVLYVYAVRKTTT